MNGAIKILQAALSEIEDQIARTETDLEATDDAHRRLLTRRADLNSERDDLRVALSRLGVASV